MTLFSMWCGTTTPDFFETDGAMKDQNEEKIRNDGRVWHTLPQRPVNRSLFSRGSHMALPRRTHLLLPMALLVACLNVHAQTSATVLPAQAVVPPGADAAASAPVMLPPPPTADQVNADETLLQARHAAMVSKALPIQEGTEARWQRWASEAWTAGGKTLDRDQAVVVVNRNPHVQQIAVMVAHPDRPWTLIGVSPISTGQAGRVQHFISPTGVFDHNGDILDYRALGTKNENGIRGIGAKGSRVWDFGWQKAQAGWIKRPELRDIRFELHATDPQILEPRLGHTASDGCIRISAGLNKFLDHYGLLDQVYWAQAPDSRALRALLPKDGEPTLPGRYMIVVDHPLN